MKPVPLSPANVEQILKVTAGFWAIARNLAADDFEDPAEAAVNRKMATSIIPTSNSREEWRLWMLAVANMAAQKLEAPG